MAQSYIGKLVQVEWEDSFGCASHWESLKDVKCEPCMAMSVGWVFSESETGIFVVPHRVQAEDEEQGCGDMVIPRSAIRIIRELAPRSESNLEQIIPTQPLAQ